MKKFFYLIIAAVMLLNACKKDEESPAASGTITLSENVINVEPKGGVYEIKITSDADWRISGFCEWANPLSESGKSGETLKIEVDENLSGEILSTQFKVFSGSAVQTLTVISNPNFIINLLSDPQVKVSSSGSIISISFDTNIPDLESVFTDNGEEWVVFSERIDAFGKTTFRYNIPENKTYKGKSTELVLRGQGKESEKITIIQHQLDAIITDNNNLVYKGLEAGKFEFKVRANVDFEIQNLPEWLRLESNTKKQNADDDGLTESDIRLAFDATDGSRIAEINFVADDDILLQMSAKQQDPNATLFDITDKALRAYLKSSGYIISSETSTECELLSTGKNVEEISINRVYNIQTIDGLKHFPNLKKLTLGSLNIQTLDLSDCGSLNQLTISSCTGLENIILNGCPVTALKYGSNYSDYLASSSLAVSSDNLTNIDLNCNSFYIAYSENCETIDVSDCPNLTELKVKREYSGIVYLKKIIISAAQQTAINQGTLKVEKSDSTEYEVKQ